ncbi:ABC transporter substrate-binding protein [Photobacterium sp. GB-27]|nr:ABC transporter substrate-binding protein [Photobacterium sp. GB-27]
MTIMRQFFHAFSLCTILLLSSPSNAEQATTYPLTVMDATQKMVSLNNPPLRVSSKSMFSDQVLIELLPAHQITSLSRLSNDPTYSLIANKLPPTIPLLDLNIERTIANQPDLLIAANWSDQQKVNILRQAGINVFVFNTVYTLADIEKNILMLGKLVNQNQRAQQLVETMDRKLKQHVIIPKHRLTAVEYTPWGASSNRQSTINTIFEQAGLINAITATQGDKYGQVPLTKEQLLLINPDVIIVPGTCGKDTNDSSNTFRQELLNDPSLQQLNAIKHHKVICLPQALRSTDSQYIVDAIIYLNHRVYGKPHA